MVGFDDGDGVGLPVVGGGVGSLVGGAGLIGQNGSHGELNEVVMNGR